MRIAKSGLVLGFVSALTLAAGWASFSAPLAVAQTAAVQAPVKVAIANPRHIIAEMAEFKVVTRLDAKFRAIAPAAPVVPGK